jgi:hypothetical protein
MIIFPEPVCSLLILIEDHKTNDCSQAGQRRRVRSLTVVPLAAPVHGFQQGFFLQDRGGVAKPFFSPRGSGRWLVMMG